jgi:predicted metal-binding membrane protein
MAKNGRTRRQVLLIVAAVIVLVAIAATVIILINDDRKNTASGTLLKYDVPPTEKITASLKNMASDRAMKNIFQD